MATTRRLRPVSDPLGSYLRVGRTDHVFLGQMLVEDRPVGSGFVVDPALNDSHRDLWVEARQRGIETVLDPRSLDLSTPGGILRSGARDLPWSPDGLHTPDSLVGGAGEDLCNQIVDMVDSDEHGAVLAPTHFIGSAQDLWIPIDGDLTYALRESLDRSGRNNVRIYYPLITNTANFHSAQWRETMIDHLRRLPIDAVWLRVHPFGTTNSGSLTLKRHLAACRDLHQIGLPLVGEHTGAVGVALMAFGAVGGIESGVTVHERTDLTSYLRPPTKKGGGNGEARIYLHELGTFLVRSKAMALLNRPGMKAAHACLDNACCRRGWKDTQSRYREHFVTRRAREATALSNVPEPLRAGNYMENFLRPASDKAVRAAEAEPALLATRKRLDSWRGTLGADLTSNPAHSFSLPAAGKLHRKTA